MATPCYSKPIRDPYFDSFRKEIIADVRSGRINALPPTSRANKRKIKHSILGYRKNYLSWAHTRKLVFIRDNYSCQICKMSFSECKIEFGCSLHVHHIIPYSILKDNSISNLISLCPMCHYEVEGKYNGFSKSRKRH
jgi:5-methylcytosine-specific restriction endonuclease McrA